MKPNKNGLDKKTLLLTSLVCLLPMVAGVTIFGKLPAQVATHFSFDGTPDGWSSRFFAVFGLPLLMLVVNAVLQVSLSADPKRQNMSGVLRAISFWLVPAVAVLCSTLTFGAALGHNTRIEVVIPSLCGVMFILVGNYLPKTKQNYTMGIKLPWTLHSEENWNRTHRLAGFLWVVCGAVFLLVSLLRLGSGWMPAVLLVVMVVVPTVYSYLLYRRGV